MKILKDYDEIKAGMKLFSISEQYYGTVERINSVLHTDCMGWGFEPISNIDIEDILLVEL